ncbi:hypothetical protein RHMOL_Rhmol04G0151200 [Rhododendron molle]|uniref:Uncharacterized protein n=1 Tax=Rhododendron molle TaxID=49168 RepID=A0ACC0P2V0_RHOML|nr:hypothetical protein RHMOL_Rhmol04G0151200 [Rhododendron molle]
MTDRRRVGEPSEFSLTDYDGDFNTSVCRAVTLYARTRLRPPRGVSGSRSVRHEPFGSACYSFEYS